MNLRTARVHIDIALARLEELQRLLLYAHGSSMDRAELDGLLYYADELRQQVQRSLDTVSNSLPGPADDLPF
jgi:predicted RNase H-like nuclease